jgi:biopolymer transport protein ExbB
MENAWMAAALKMGMLARTVAVVQLSMSIAVVAAALLKWRELRARTRATRAFAPAFSRALARDDVDGALALCRTHEGSQLATVLSAALGAARPFLGDPEHAELRASVAEVAADREQILVTGQLRRGLNLLAAIGATATLLGLLGTVGGIFNSFAAMARAGGGSVEVIAVGAGEALLTTALGIGVAIPALWLYTYFSSRLERVFAELDYGVQELIEWLMVRDTEAVEPVMMPDAELLAGVP